MLTRKLLVRRLSDELAPELLILSGDGVSNILFFRKEASKHMKLVANDDDDVDTAIGMVANAIKREFKDLKPDSSSYNTRIGLDDALESCSHTLLSLLSHLSPKLDSTLPAALIGNTVTGTVTKKPTSL